MELTRQKDELLASDELKKRATTGAAKKNPQSANATLSNGPEILPGRYDST
ncbi:MAG TPA: hypothetical protein VF748_06365 [Candidatus Acidoferrum sp.]